MVQEIKIPVFPKKLSGSFWGITTFFNPEKYKTKLENYKKFRESNKKQGLKLLAVELVLGDNSFELTNNDADILIQLRLDKKNVLWHKESLFNIGLKNLPKDCDKVAWIDCDIIFKNDDWINDFSKLLEKYKVLQGFSHIIRLSKGMNDIDLSKVKDGKKENEKSFGQTYSLVTNKIQRDYSGYVWCARKSALDKVGFFDEAIIGGGDRLMSYAFYGKLISKIERAKEWYSLNPPKLLNRYFTWLKKVKKEIKGSCYYSNQIILHLWHGDHFDRKYELRNLILTNYDFDPKTDLKKNKYGCFEWASDKYEMHEEIKKYFKERNEDGSFIRNFFGLFKKDKLKESQIFNKKEINVVTSVDMNFVKYFPTLVNSISKNTSVPIKLYLLTRGIDDRTKNKILSLNFPKIQIDIIEMDNYLKNVNFYLPKNITKSTIDRLFLTSLLPNLKKAIYLDIDLIVNADLKKLYNMSTSNKGICAKTCISKDYKDIRGELKVWAKNDKGVIKAFPGKINLKSSCFNAGVMVLDLDKLRKNNFENKMIAIMTKYPLIDQFLLNLYANGDYRELPASWNVFASQDNPKEKNIIHWVGCYGKPWDNHKVSFYSYWKKYYYPFQNKFFEKINFKFKKFNRKIYFRIHHYLGEIGIFIKNYSPKLYFLLKRLKGDEVIQENKPSNSYWLKRMHLNYYKRVIQLAQDFGKNSKSAIDIGSQKTPILEYLPNIKDRTALDKSCFPGLKDITNIKQDFFDFNPPKKYDLALCLQVLEHVNDPKKFLQKIFSISKLSIISVPYKWSTGTKYHIHNMIDESIIFKWANKSPIYSEIVEEKEGIKRIILVYNND